MLPENRPYLEGRPIHPELASGAVLLDSSRSRVLLLHHARERRWCFPKGHVDPGETLAQAALREVREESGLARVLLVREIATVQYRFFQPRSGENVLKTTVYFLGHAEEEALRLEDTFDLGEWVAPAEGLRRLPYPEDRRVLASAWPFVARR